MITEVSSSQHSHSDEISGLVRRFNDTGYIVLEEVFEQGYIEELRTAYNALIEKYLSDKGGIGALDGKTFGLKHVGCHPALSSPWSDSQIVSNPRADAVMSALLGEDYQCGYYHSNAAYPGSGVQGIHRDVKPLFTGEELNVPHPVTSIVLNIPLCDFTEENGSTEVWPGTHLWIDRSATDGREVDVRAASTPSERTNVKAGALILRDLRMFHRGMPNRSSEVRAMLSIVYVRSFRVTGELEIPQSTWDSWQERTRAIFRNNAIVPDNTVTSPYRIAKTSQ